ncbi:MAG TPA: cupin domain-containing protein [Streptosporangiaceae bacterium]|nr:cupin domain-containing protein [Streptosporangiaceae bacterium]
MASRVFADGNGDPSSLDRGMLIGPRLRHRRLELGMTARELARRVDCSPSLISQVERGRAVPSVSTLWALVTALRISMDRLFDPAQDGPATKEEDEPEDDAQATAGGPVLRRNARPRIRLERGVVWERLTAMAEKEMEFLEVCYGVGQSAPEAEHAIQHNGQEYAVIIEGALFTQIGFERYVLEVGDSLTFDSTIPHRFWNAGDVPARAIWVIINRH